MTDLLQKIILFIGVLGVLVAFHEYGHFIVARKLGVKVLRFSIGFGTPLFKYQKTPNSTEYVIAALPLGGYVKMLDEREGDVHPSQRSFAFNRQAIWKRMAIVLAGPMFNLILAFVVFAAVYMVGIQDIKPVVSQPALNTPVANVSIETQSQILSVNSHLVESWSDLRMRLLKESVANQDITLVWQTPEGVKKSGTFSLPKNLLEDEGDPIKKMGLEHWMPLVTIGEVKYSMPAANAGLMSGDIIMAVNGQPTRHWNDLLEQIKNSAGQTIRMEYQRADKIHAVDITPKIQNDGQGQVRPQIGIGPQRYTKENNPYQHFFTTVRYPLLQALNKGLQKTYNLSVMTVQLIGKLITGQASVKNLSGPLSIAYFADQSAKLGWVNLLEFVGLISVSLGVLNLLPIPVLDGGHLVMYAIEGIKGSPLSERVLIVGQQLGLAMLVSVMGLAFYNDWVRFF